MEILNAYIPIDRYLALSAGHTLPDRVAGAAMLADLSGFTALTEALTQELGPLRGAEEMTDLLNQVYDALIAEVHAYGGTVISFSGDAITCWFDEAHGVAREARAAHPPPDATSTPVGGDQAGPFTGDEGDATSNPVGGDRAGPFTGDEGDATSTPVGGDRAGPFTSDEGDATSTPVGGDQAGPFTGDEGDATSTPVGGDQAGPFTGDEAAARFGAATLRAAAAALAMQQAMGRLANVTTRGGKVITLGMKISIAAGPVRRLMVGDPAIQQIDTLAGLTMEHLAAAEQQASRGEIMLDATAAAALGPTAELSSWRKSPQHGPVAVLSALRARVAPMPWPATAGPLGAEQLRPWLLPPVYQRLQAGGGEFLAELRPCVALFLSFSGLEFDDDPEVGAKLDGYVRAVQRVLLDYNAFLIQLIIGDKGCYIYGAFGALQAHGDDAARAAAAALDLRAIRHEQVREVRIGVSAGRARVGAYGGQLRRTYGVLGDEVNVAARLMAAARPGQIIFSPAARRAAGATFAWEPLPPLKLKGKSEPLAPLRLVGTTAGQITADPAQGLTPVLGREAELAQIAALVESAAAGAPRVLLLEGEAGSGKSRMLAEVARLAEAQGLRPLYGGGQSMERETPYFAWRSVLATALGIGGSDPPATQRQRVEAWAATAPELAERLPLIDAVLPVALPETPLIAPLGPAERHALRVELLIDLLRHAAAGPPVLLLEDTQWFDSRSWALALTLACACLADHTPLLLVLTTSPLDAGERPVELDALAALPGSVRLRLEPLPDAAVLALAAARLGLSAAEIPPGVAALLCERAAGNPLLAEELALALRDQGFEPHARGSAEPGRPHDAEPRLELPDTVQGVVLARIDRLSLEEQLTLKVGAVIGRSFGYQPLRAALTPLLPDQSLVVGSSLLTLTRREMLTTAQQPGRTYLFRQGVIREVAYDTLLFAQRRVLHRAVAEWYEQTYGEPGALAPHYALLAGHWDAADEAVRSVYYLALAGEQALRASALREARSLFARAVRRLDDGDAQPARRAELCTRLGVALWYAGELEEAEAQLRAGLEAARASGVRQRTVETLSYLGRVQIERDDYATARATIEAALALVTPDDGPAVRLLALRYLGVAAARQGAPEAAALLDEALALAVSAGDRFAEAAVLIELGNLATEAGQFAEAARGYRQALAAAEATGHRWSMAVILGNLGELAARQGDYAEAIAHNQASLAIDRAIGNRLGQAITLINTGEVAAATGDVAGATRCYAEALPLALGTGNAFFTLYGLYDAAQLLAGAGQTAEAVALLTHIQSHPGAADLAASAAERLAELAPATAEPPAHLADAVAAAEHWLARLS